VRVYGGTYLFPVHDIEFSVPLNADVTCTEPVLVECVFRGLGVVKVALRYEGATDEHLAFLPGLDVIVVLIDHPVIVSRTTLDNLLEQSSPQLNIRHNRRDTPRNIDLMPLRHHRHCPSSLTQSPSLSHESRTLP
jgi:hypothetical protein